MKTISLIIIAMWIGAIMSNNIIVILVALSVSCFVAAKAIETGAIK